MRTIQRDIASAVLLSKDGKVFLARKGGKAVFAGTWTIPGGGIDEGEGKEQAMQREILEETGIDVKGMQAELVDVGQGSSEKTLKDTGERVMVDMTFYDFQVMLDKNAEEIKLTIDPSEFEEANWFTKDELATLQLSPTCEKLFRKIKLLT